MNTTRVRTGIVSLVAIGFAWASSAVAAPTQFPLVGTERLNEFGSGLPGTPYNTPPDGVDYDQIGSLDPHPGQIVINGNIPELNYNTGGGNLNFAFGPDLDFELNAVLSDFQLIVNSPTDVDAIFEFDTLGDASWDLVVRDPADANPATNIVLQADFVGGLLNGSPVAAMTATINFDPTSPPPSPALQTFAFFEVDPNVANSAYSSLFADGVGGLNVGLGLGSMFNFNPTFDIIAAALLADPTPGGVPSSTAEAQGVVYSLSSSQFQVPEPSALALLGLTALVLVARRRTRA